MSEVRNLVWRSVKWRFQNPITIVMTLVNPLMWLLLFANLFGGEQKNYIDFVLAGILVMGVLSSAGMSGIANYSLKENGSYYRIIISPIRRTSIIIAHAIDALVLTGIQIGVMLFISFILGVRIQTGMLGFLCLLLLLTITVFFVSILSYILSISIPDENAFIAMINTFVLPLFFLSSALMEKSSMPKVFQVITTINPFTYVVQSLRNIIMNEAINWNFYVLAFIIMSILAVLVGIGARKRMESHS